MRSIDTHQDSQFPPNSIAWGSLGVLSFTYMFSVLDRTILVLLIDPIKADFQLTDTQVSLVTGLAFALVYTLSAVPMGRIADIWVRKYVIAVGVIIWSVLTILCGFAKNFTQLFLARMGVGLGEAALTPAAYSMIPDLFSPSRLARAMSIFGLSAAIGHALSMILGGVIVKLVADGSVTDIPLFSGFSAWQIVLICAGSLSLFMVVPLLLMPEPKRQLVQTNSETREHGESVPFAQVIGFIWRERSFYGFIILAHMFYALYIYGFGGWLPTYFIRVHDIDAGSIGILLGVLVLLPQVVGSVAGGWLSDRFFSKGNRQAPILVVLYTLPVGLCGIPLVFYAEPMALKYLGLILLWLTHAIPGVIFPTTVQMVTPNRIRGQVAAIKLVFTNMCGVGLGATIVALVTDYVFEDDMAVGHSIALVSSICVMLVFLFMFLARRGFEKRVIDMNIQP